MTFSRFSPTQIDAQPGQRAWRPGMLLVLGFCFWGDVEILLAADSSPDDIQVTEGTFGFDGAIQSRQFLPLSLKVQNLSPSPWTGTLRIFRRTGQGQRVGAVLETEVSLQPEETRWVQVVVYVIDDFEEWQIEWGPEEAHRYVMTGLKLGPKPTVLIYDPDAVTPSSGVLRRMPEDLFPTTVAGASGLRGIILAHSPFWQGARVRSFLEWLELGGRVYILQNDDGQFPNFPKALAVLNRSETRFQIGQGTVQRIPLRVNEITLDQARQRIFQDDDVGQGRRLPVLLRQQNYYTSGNALNSGWDADTDLFTHLAGLASFQRRWWLIFLCVLLYLLALHPWCYRIGTLDRHVRRFYLAFLGSVVAFSCLFVFLGRLGASAQNRIRSAAVAHSLGDERYLVTQWSYLAAAQAGSYAIEHATTGTGCSTAQDIETVLGHVRLGDPARSQFQMPPASTRQLVHKGALRYQRPRPQLGELVADLDRLERLSFSIAGCYETDLLRVTAAYRGNLYFLKEQSGQLVLDRSKPAAPLIQELGKNETLFKAPLIWWMGTSTQKKKDYSEQLRYREIGRYLIGSSFGLTTEVDLNRLKSSDDAVRLMVLVPMPREFFSLAPEFTDQSGAVLFVYDFPVDRSGSL
ncbi:MAG: hypothetical protein KDA80_19690 [Planctomycetaceae bacterium]|nr:hypothetical protein [Planctomycetaceae bacterium]